MMSDNSPSSRHTLKLYPVLKWLLFVETLETSGWVKVEKGPCFVFHCRKLFLWSCCLVWTEVFALLSCETNHKTDSNVHMNRSDLAYRVFINRKCLWFPVTYDFLVVFALFLSDLECYERSFEIKCIVIKYKEYDRNSSWYNNFDSQKLFCICFYVCGHYVFRADNYHLRAAFSQGILGRSEVFASHSK